MKRPLSPPSSVPWRLSLLLLVPVLACQENGFVRVKVVEIDGGTKLPLVYQIQSTATDTHGTSSTAKGPTEVDAITFPQTFVVELPPTATSLTEVVAGLDQAGNIVLRGSNSTNFSAGSQNIPLQVNLSPACSSSLDCNPAAFCQGQTVCTAEGACVTNTTTSPPGFGVACGNDGGRCDQAQRCFAPFGLCGDGVTGTDPQPDGGFSTEQCDWGNGIDGGPCSDAGCNSDAPNACRPNCVLPSCGDGIIDTGEVCDLGALNGTEQGCNATCSLIGTATRIVGNGDHIDGGICPGNCYVDGPGDQAQFEEISGIAVVGTTLYVADTGNEVVRAVDLTPGNGYAVSTLAGSPANLMTQDGIGSAAGFFLPQQPLGYQGMLLVGTAMNVRQITLPVGDVTTLAGPDIGNKAAENPVPLYPPVVPLNMALFSDVTGVAVDPATGLIYTADQGGGYLRQIDPTANTVINLAGGGIGATFNQPTSCVVINGGLFVSESSALANDIRLASLDNGDGGSSVVTTVAGNGGAGFTDSNAPGDAGATFNKPQGLCTDGKTIFIVDTFNTAIRQMDPATFIVTTVIGGPDAGIFDAPYDCAWDPATGILYVSDQSTPQASPDGVGNVIYAVQ